MTSLPLTIRPARPRDLPGLRRLDTWVLLDQPDASLDPLGPVAATVAGFVPSQHRPRVLVAESDAGTLAVAVFHALAPDHRWRLAALGAATGVYDVQPIWTELIARGVVLAGLRGVKRLYARAPAGSVADAAARAVGFAPYATETLWAVTSPRPATGDAVARRQDPTDTWAVHHLYIRSVPAPVQVAEASTSHHWDLAAGRPRVAVDGLLVEDGHHVVAYARIATNRRQSTIELMANPDRLDAAAVVLDDAIAREVAAGRSDGIVCVVRGYQQELGGLLEARGFRDVGDQELLVKYTTARVAAPAHVEAAAVPGAVRERLAKPKQKRAPSFYVSHGDDPAGSGEG